MEGMLGAFSSFTGFLKSPLKYFNMSKSDGVSSYKLERTKMLKAETDKFKRLNDSVYELLPEKKPDAVVVLFHGFFSDEDDKDYAFWRTWKMKDSEECWPVTLLPELLKTKSRDLEEKVSCKIRVLAMSYNGSPEVPENIGNKGTDDYLLARNFIRGLILDEDVALGQEDENIPIFLVGHDLGGILIKQFVLAVDERASMENSIEIKDKLDKFLAKLSSVFFYATPHSGSRTIENFAANIPKGSQHLGLNLMKVLGKEMGRVNQRFTAYKNQTPHERYSRCRTYAVFPLKKTIQVGGRSVYVLEEASARNGIDDFHSIDADHLGVCQVEGLHSDSMRFLGQRIREESVAFKKRRPNAAVNGMQKKAERSSGAKTQNTPTERNTEVNDMKKAAGLRNLPCDHGSNIHTLQELKSRSEGKKGIPMSETAFCSKKPTGE